MNKASSNQSQIKDDQQLDLLSVRVALLQRRQSLASWARANGYLIGTTHNALTGRRVGKMSRRIVRTLRRELGL